MQVCDHVTGDPKAPAHVPCHCTGSPFQLHLHPRRRPPCPRRRCPRWKRWVRWACPRCSNPQVPNRDRCISGSQKKRNQEKWPKKGLVWRPCQQHPPPPTFFFKRSSFVGPFPGSSGASRVFCRRRFTGSTGACRTHPYGWFGPRNDAGCGLTADFSAHTQTHTNPTPVTASLSLSLSDGSQAAVARGLVAKARPR